VNNRIHHIWEAIDDAQLREQLRQREEIQARAAMRLMKREDMRLSIRIVTHPDPLQPTVHHFHTVLFLGSFSLLLLDSYRTE